jgi:hypothetical protein
LQLKLLGILVCLGSTPIGDIKFLLQLADALFQFLLAAQCLSFSMDFSLKTRL